MKVFTDNYIGLWTFISTIAQVGGTVFVLAALGYSIYTYKKSWRLSNYSTLDQGYSEILKIAMEHPFLIDLKEEDMSHDQIIKYNLFAYLVWNFIETIYDQCQQDSLLCATWFPVIRHENSLHRKWFNRDENKNKYKPRFYKFIQSEQFLNL